MGLVNSQNSTLGKIRVIILKQALLLHINFHSFHKQMWAFRKRETQDLLLQSKELIIVLVMNVRIAKCSQLSCKVATKGIFRQFTCAKIGYNADYELFTSL